MDKHTREKYRQHAVPAKSTLFAEKIDDLLLILVLLICFWMLLDSPAVVQWWNQNFFGGKMK